MLAGHLGHQSRSYDELRYFNYLGVVLIVSFYLLPDFSLVPMVGGSVSASRRACRHYYVTDRCKQWGNGRKRDDEANSATHYIIQAKICLSCSRTLNCSLFATMSTFRV